MVKDNKFAAEPTADGTADAKVDQSGKPKSTDAVQADTSKMATTKNAVGHDAGSTTDQHAKNVAKLDKKQVYNDYAHGKVIDEIAAENNVNSQDIVDVINEKEASKKK